MSQTNEQLIIQACVQPNLMKSSIVYAGVPDQVKALLFDILEISEGVLPVKYVGVPLITTTALDSGLRTVLFWLRKS